MIFGQKMHFLPTNSGSVKKQQQKLEVSQRMPKTSFRM